ncbi:MAG: TVP38/TMEM64 family protein [Verrucomicrobiota bacterium]|nr:TVP38/TMEM64 family protein [Verrucomicrobiota bacterium]
MNWLKKYWKWIALAAVLIALSTATAFLPVKDWVKAFSDYVQTLGAWGVVLFIAVYALGTVLFLPGWIFTVAAGLIYGVIGGTAVALAGAIIGATLAFLCGRYLVRERVKAATKGNKKFAAIDTAIGEQGWKVVGLLRLSPLIPFNLSNYFYGVTAVGFVPYLLASAIGMLPGTLLYAYLGGAGKAGLSGGGGSSTLKYVLLGLGLVATIAVTVIVSRAAKKALAKTGATKAK